MSKSTKPSGPIDERNLYVKRLKATNAPQKVTDASSTVKQSDAARSNLVPKSKRSIATLNKHVKSKIPSPVNPKPMQTMQAPTQIHSQASSRGDKRLPSPSVHTAVKSSGMKDNQESVETMSQPKTTKKDVAKVKVKNEEHIEQKEKEKKIENIEPASASNTNGRATESVVVVVVAQESIVENTDKETNDSVANKILTTTDNVTDSDSCKILEQVEKEPSKEQKNEKESEEQPQEDIIILEYNETIEKTEEKRQVVVEEKEIVVKIDERPSGSNVVESTTSESSPVKEVEVQATKDEKFAQETQNDVSFISYDSNIMLKDVKIKLNDCLRENSKLLDVTDPNASMSEAFKDLSFGRTLRGISGRNSISRLRNVTVRERRPSPNDSLFVNTSRASYALDRSRYTPEKSPYHNGSRLERKRKILEDNEPSTKKLKTEEGYSLLNTSLEYLKNLRKPVQFSTPNTRGYKFDIDEKTSVNDQTITIEDATEPKKWCVVM